MDIEPPEWIDTKEACRLLGVNIDTLRRWTRIGKVTSFRPGHRYQYRASDIQALLDRSVVRARDDEPNPAA